MTAALMIAFAAECNIRFLSATWVREKLPIPKNTSLQPAEGYQRRRGTVNRILIELGRSSLQNWTGSPKCHIKLTENGLSLHSISPIVGEHPPAYRYS
jgi:hypothetical protein